MCDACAFVCSGEVVDLPTPPGLREAVQVLGLHRALGFIRMLQLSPEDSFVRPEPQECASQLLPLPVIT